MILRTFIVSDSQEVREVDSGVAARRTNGRCTWIDVEDPEGSELSEWLAELGFSRRSIRAAIALKGRTRVVSSGNETWFEFPALAAEIGSARVPHAVLCQPALVVTVHGLLVEGLSKTMNRLVKEDGLTGTDATAVVAAHLAGLSHGPAVRGGWIAGTGSRVRDALRRAGRAEASFPTRLILDYYGHIQKSGGAGDRAKYPSLD